MLEMFHEQHPKEDKLGKGIPSACAPPPSSLVGAFYLHPPDARARFLYSDLTCNNTCSVTGGA